MRILFLTQWFDPEPTPKGITFVKYLKKLGHDVEVLSPIPNYPKGRFYNGYKFKLIHEEHIDDIRIMRAPIFPSHDKSSLRRALTYLSFTISSLIGAIFLTKRCDLIYAYHPPNIGFVAILVGFIKRVPVVHDVQDLWPETFHSTGMIKEKIKLKVINAFSTWVYKRVDSLVVISPGFKKNLIGRGIPHQKINVVFNWCDESKILKPKGLHNNPIRNNDKFNIVFAGNIGKAQNLTFILEAAKFLSNESPGIHFNLIGDGLELSELQNYSNRNGLNNVSFIPRVPMSQIGSILSQADALLVHLKRDPLFEITIPSKIQAYMAIGKPIINTVGGDASDIISDSNAGINVVPDDLEGLIRVCNQVSQMNEYELSEFGENGKTYYQNNFSLMRGSESLEEIFKSVILER